MERTRSRGFRSQLRHVFTALGALNSCDSFASDGSSGRSARSALRGEFSTCLANSARSFAECAAMASARQLDARKYPWGECANCSRACNGGARRESHRKRSAQPSSVSNLRKGSPSRLPRECSGAAFDGFGIACVMERCECTGRSGIADVCTSLRRCSSGCAEFAISGSFGNVAALSGYV